MAAMFGRGRVVGTLPQLWKSSTRNAAAGANAYYVLLPEVPPDTAETNVVMRTDQLPQFSEITTGKCVTACAKLAIEYETQLERHIGSLKDLKKEKTFETVYSPVEEISVPLNTAWALVKNLNYVSEDYRKTFSRIHSQVERARNERWVSETLFYSFKELKANEASLNDFQKRVVDLYLLEGRLNGTDLSVEDRSLLMEGLRVISKECNNFRNKVRICTEMFTHDVTDFNQVEEMPWPMLAEMSRDSLNPTRGPWRATLQPASYQAMMKYCGDRMTRWNLWHAYHNRASQMHAAQYLNNNKLIENLRNYRSEVAKRLGYENFAEMSMETKMAESVENVLSMIETLKLRFAPLLWEDVAQLQKFAASEGFKKKLEMWDISYWQRRQKEHLYSFDRESVKEYFPVNTVLLGLFDLCTNLFGINFEEVTPEVEVWHSDVRFFNVLETDGTHLGSFYFDAFDRPEKLSSGYMDMGRENSEIAGTWPYSYFSLRIPRPASAQDPALMRFEDVQNLFQEFGNGLQQLLTKVPYSEIAGQKNIEWDAVQACSKFMKFWLTEPSIVKSISGHYSTGKQIPDDLVYNLLKSVHHSYNFDMMYQLYVSAFDMEVYMTKNHWRTVMQQLWENFLPLSLQDDDNLPCSMMPIFCELYPAAYYSHKWSEMIAADLFSAFRETGLENTDEIKALGRRFRETYLSLGGGVPASEVFRRFRGRDPSTEALQPLQLIKPN